MNAERFRLIVAGGGTGGHFFPGLAVAQAVVALRPESEVLFVGSARGIEARLAQRSGFPFKALPASGFASVSAAARVRALASVPAALALGLGTLLQTRPHAVLGVGGYASVPMGLAAGLSGIPLVLLEQNVAPGLANRLLSRFAALVAVAFPQTKAAFRGKGRVLGNPVRASLTAVPPESGPERPLRLLVFGGSGGSSALNAAMTEALPALRGFPGGVDILHQTGEREVEHVRAAYENSGVSARVEPFLHDMDRAYAWCHACVCRAGATTLAEIAAARRPALLIPFPQSAGGHQSANARGMEEMGGALRIEQADLTTATLMEALGRLAERTVRERMAKALGKAARPDAARAIAEYVLLAGGRP